MKRWLIVALIVGAILIVFIVLRNRKIESEECEAVEELEGSERFTDAVGSLTDKVKKRYCVEECKRKHSTSASKRNTCIYKCS